MNHKSQAGIARRTAGKRAPRAGKRIISLLLCALFFSFCVLPASALGEKNRHSLFPLLRGRMDLRIFEQFRAASITPLKRGEKKPENEKPLYLCPGGDTFGMELYVEGVLIVGVNEEEARHPAYDAGIRRSDLLIEMDGERVTNVEDVSRVMDRATGAEMEVVCMRGKEEMRFRLTPYRDGEGKLKVGILVRDNVAGIGTLTYFDPTTGEFGGLGHGICDPETGMLVPLSRGAAADVTLTDIVAGAPGKPGELRGYLTSEKLGTLLLNTEWGVFGVFSPIPARETLPVGHADTIRAGDAILRCALGEDEPRDYRVTLSSIDPDDREGRCFTVTVTDPDLLARTGGIVQGMSGSPIIQGGKLVGAVTHVLISDPTKGYGITVDRMLAEARSAS